MKLVIRFRIFPVLLLAAMVMLCLPVKSYAQSSKLTAVFRDSSNDNPLEFATVSVTKKNSEKPSKYVLTTEDGKAQLQGLSSGIYILKMELMGYKAHSQEVKIADSDVDLGIIKVSPDAKQLEAASVSATGNPIIIKKDTVEYAATSFKTTENDVLEDLLKKLPGVEVSEDGSITANGKAISKITIDGKTFFLDDPQLASKNIPAKIVDKVKVYERKSDQAAFTGIDDGNTETVIDLSIQKGMMKGLFGNIRVGGGHDIPEHVSGSSIGHNDGDWRYQGAGFIGRFSDKSQLSVILNGNNTNNRGFNDIAGGMMGGMRGGGMGRGGGGWGNGNGITTSWMGGLNGNLNLLDGKMDLGGNYLYNNTRNDVKEITDKVTYLDDKNLISHTDGYSLTNSDGHRFGIRLEHKFSENTSILFQPQVNFGKGDFTEFSRFNTDTQIFDAETGSMAQNKTNDGFNRSFGQNDNWRTNGFFLFRQKLGIPGRTLSFNLRYDFSGNELDGFNQSRTTVYEKDLTGESEYIATPDIINQRYDQTQKKASLSGKLSYTEPLGKGFYFEGSYLLSWNRNHSVKSTFDSAGDNMALDHNNLFYNRTDEMFNETYSNDILNRYIDHEVSATFMYQKDKLRAQVGASLNPTDTHNETNGETYDSKVLNWAPRAMMWYDITENSNLRVFYHGHSHQPSTSQLMPVPDNSNPLHLSFGNPYLIPFFEHGFYTEYSITNKKTFTSMRVSLNGGLTQKPVVNATWYDLAGVQYSIPVNGKASGNVATNIFVNSPIAKSNFSVSSMTRASFSQSSSYLGAKFATDKYYSDGDFDYALFHQDFPDLDKAEEFTLNKVQSVSAMERLRFTYRNDFVEVNLGGRTRLQKSWFTVASASTNTTWNNQLQTSMQWTIPGGLGLNTEFDYNWYRGYTTQKEDEYVFNVELTKLLFKKKVTLAAKAYDIFNQSKNLSITDSSNFHQETWNNTLGRYIIVSLTYRFGANKDRPAGMGRPPRMPDAHMHVH